jgi:hypothetical protein
MSVSILAMYPKCFLGYGGKKIRTDRWRGEEGRAERKREGDEEDKGEGEKKEEREEKEECMHGVTEERCMKKAKGADKNKRKQVPFYIT